MSKARDQAADEIEAVAKVAAAMLRQPDSSRDWIDECGHGGDVIFSDDAADILQCSAPTVRRRCTEAQAAGRPIGVLIAEGCWLISRRRLLASIERSCDRSALLIATERATKQMNFDRARSKLEIQAVS